MIRTFRFSLGNFLFSASLDRVNPRLAAYSRKIALSYGRALEARFPELREFGLVLTEDNASEVTDFYASYLPFVHADSRSAATRSILKTLMETSQDQAVKTPTAVAIAKSDLADGLADRALLVRHLPEWQREAEAWEKAYGSPIITVDWKGADRGATLRLFSRPIENCCAARTFCISRPRQTCASGWRIRTMA